MLFNGCSFCGLIVCVRVHAYAVVVCFHVFFYCLLGCLCACDVYALCVRFCVFCFFCLLLCVVCSFVVVHACCLYDVFVVLLILCALVFVRVLFVWLRGVLFWCCSFAQCAVCFVVCVDRGG